MSRSPFILVALVCLPIALIAVVSRWEGTPAPVAQFAVTSLGPGLEFVTARTNRQSAEPFALEHFAKLSTYRVTGIVPPSARALPARDVNASLSSTWVSEEGYSWRLVTFLSADQESVEFHAAALAIFQSRYAPRAPESEFESQEVQR